MPEGSPARAVVAAAIILALAAGAVWGVLQWRASSAEVSQPAATSESAPPAPSPAASPDAEEPSPEPERSPESEPSPSSSPDPDTDEHADDGPATGPYAAFSPSHQLTHPDTDPDIRRWYDWFGYFIDDEVGVPSGEWTNKDELWDELAPSLAEEAKELGEEIHAPRFPGMEVVPAIVNVRWSHEDTLGRGVLVEFSAVYSTDGEDSKERYWPVLIQTLPDGSGVIGERMDSFDLATSHFASFADLRAEAGERQWEWVLRQSSRANQDS